MANAQAEAREWLVHLRSGKATPEDIEAFRRWRAEHPEHVPGIQLVGDAWGTLHSAAAELIAEHPEEHPALSLQRLRTAGAGAHPLRPGRRALVGFAVAAGASWLALRPPLGLWPALGDLAADYRTGTGEHRQVMLSDRVAVEMNTQTRINVLSGRATHGVDLLAGEAEIVAGKPSAAQGDRGRPVVVVAGRGKLQADVARFDVRLTANEVCVTCVSGSVAFEHPRRSLTLLASQQLTYDDREVRQVSQADPMVETAWRRGVLVFNGAPLTRVVDEINRYRPGKIILRGSAPADGKVEALVYTANLDGAIDMLARLYDMHVTKLPGNIVLLG